MIKIPLSEVLKVARSAELFTDAVARHRNALEAHRLGKPGIGAPQEPELIDSLVRRVPDTGPVAERKADQFVVAEFEIFDDSPPPPTLEERKVALMFKLQGAAAAARAAVLSPAKANLLSLDANQALSLPEENRSPSERAAIEAYSAYVSASADIERAFARHAVDIEDLTEASIDGYQLPSL